MNPAEAARQKLAAASSALRFAVLFSPREQRTALTALFAMYLEIREVLHECSDAGVARAKLGWWQEEIALLLEHKPRHPLAINLSHFMAQRPLPSGLFLEIIESAAMDIALPAIPHFDDVERYCQHRGGVLLELAALLCGAQQAATLDAARKLGMSWQLAEIVLRSALDAEHGRVYFAADDLCKHGLDRHIVSVTHTDAGLKALLADYAQRARAFQDAAALNMMGEPALSSGWILTSLAQVRLKKFTRLDYNPAASPVELHPLVALFTAWHSARNVSR